MKILVFAYTQLKEKDPKMAVRNVNGPIGESSSDVSAWQRSDIPSWKYCCRPIEESCQAPASSRADTGRLINYPEGMCLFPHRNISLDAASAWKDSTSSALHASRAARGLAAPATWPAALPVAWSAAAPAAPAAFDPSLVAEETNLHDQNKVDR